MTPAIAAPPPSIPKWQLSRRPDSLCQLLANYTPRWFPRRGALVEEKHDGIRALWINGQLVSRLGLPIWCSAHLWPELARLEADMGGAVFFDGEYVEPGGFVPTIRAFNGSRWNNAPVPGRGVLHLFDAVPGRVWDGAQGPPLVRRKAALAWALHVCPRPGLVYVPHDLAHFPIDVDAMAARVWARGGEGVVVKRADSPHLAIRSRDWQRLKRKLTLDLPVIGYGEGKGGDKGTLGHIICDLGGAAVKVAVGFSDRERAVLWHYPDRLIARVAEIEAMELSEWGGVRSSRFLRWREDKEIGFDC